METRTTANQVQADEKSIAIQELESKLYSLEQALFKLSNLEEKNPHYTVEVRQHIKEFRSHYKELARIVNTLRKKYGELVIETGPAIG